ncbi:MAG: class I SAM-dependent methyltransferase [Synechococcus sp.]|nr:class I SAM-dependent methyltransferase [Synechococcus sp.]
MTQAFWDQRFGRKAFAYGEQPNDFLVEQASALPPGDAICLAEGEGRNAVYLASLGHRVVAQDFSAVGLAKAQALALRRGVALRVEQGDLAAWNPSPVSVDLVVAIWMHLPASLRRQVLAKAAWALRPGGVLLLEGYGPEQLGLGTGGPPVAELLIPSQALRQELAGLELELLRDCRRVVQEGAFHQGESAVVQLRARKPIP